MAWDGETLPPRPAKLYNVDMTRILIGEDDTTCRDSPEPILWVREYEVIHVADYG
jgi:hypothetical protein